jgi:thiol-disulfide isomerase/thioredoxin
MRLPFAVAAIAFAALLAGAAGAAGLYKCVAQNGKVGYQDEPCPPTAGEKKLAIPYGDSTGAGPGGLAVVDADAAAKRVAERLGTPTVLVLYSVKCPLCQQMFPQLVALANQYRGRGVEWEVFSTDAQEDFGEVVPYMAGYRAPFPAVAIRPWVPGGLTRAFAPLGITVNAQWTRPLVAVRDGKGKVVMQAEGVADLTQVRGAVDVLAH